MTPIVVVGCIFAASVVFVWALWRARQRRRAEFLETPAERVAEEQFLKAAESESTADESSVAKEEEQESGTAEQIPALPVVARDDVLRDGLRKTQAGLMGRLADLWSRKPKIDLSILTDLEEILLTADVGVGFTTRVLDAIREDIQANRIGEARGVQQSLRAKMLESLGDDMQPIEAFLKSQDLPRIVLFVGVNGVGKTTTVGKVANYLVQQKKQKVVLAAADTFRAAATEQLEIWGERTGARVIKGQPGSDPASVVFNAVEYAKQNQADVVLCDTAGRLHTKTELMDEIKKIKRACQKARAGAPDATWLVVDATTGQNAVQQAKEFHQALGLSGVVLTKLDGTAKGGVVVAIADQLKLPVCFVGVGEKAGDLRPFSRTDFVDAIFMETSG